MRKISREAALKLIAVCPHPEGRAITGAFDYGDEASCGCCVKTIESLRENPCGVFFGQHGGEYFIAVIDAGNVVDGGEMFKSLEEMHGIWMVD